MLGQDITVELRPRKYGRDVNIPIHVPRSTALAQIGSAMRKQSAPSKAMANNTRPITSTANNET
jgi:hypothetical protein